MSDLADNSRICTIKINKLFIHKVNTYIHIYIYIYKVGQCRAGEVEQGGIIFDIPTYNPIIFSFPF